MGSNLKRLGLVGGMLLVLLLPALGNAHRVNVFCWAEGRTISCEASFSEDNPVHQGVVTVRTAKGEKLLNGRTDDEGAFSFTVPSNCTTDLEIEVQAGMGHQNSWPVKAAEYLPAAQEIQASSQSQDKPANAQDANVRDMAPPAPEADVATLEATVRKAVAAELGPLKEQVAQLQQNRVSIEDVIAGLGYILGLMGIGFYFSAKKR
ncbi:MAG: hypothetical protein R6Y91_05365 [Desulfohalobium sp.]